MSRQSISFTPPNDDWLKAQVESQEFASKSEVVNDLIRKARRRQQEMDYIRVKLIEGEQSGFVEVTEKTRDQILTKAKAKARENGYL